MLQKFARFSFFTLFFVLTCNQCSPDHSRVDSNDKNKNDPFASLDVAPCESTKDCDSGDICSSFGVCLTYCTQASDCDASKGFSCLKTSVYCTSDKCTETNYCADDKITAAISQYYSAYNNDPTKNDNTDYTDINNEASAEMVPATISGKVVLSKNFPGQFRDLFYPTFNSGSKMARGRLIAVFYADANATTPIAITMGAVQGMDDQGVYMYSTGFPKDFIISEAPKGNSYLRLILDTHYSIDNNKGGCSSISDCPGDTDVLQTELTTIQTNGGSGNKINNPKASTIAINSTSQNVGTITLGSIYISGKEIHAAPPKDNGTLLVATSGKGNSYRNDIKIINLQDYSISDDSYTLQSDDDNGDFPGDICGLIRGDDSLYAVATYANYDGAAIFKLDPKTGKQTSDLMSAFIENESKGNAKTMPYPCRGLSVKDSSGKEHLYLIQFQGAGSLETSQPYPFYHVNLANKVVDTPFSNSTYVSQAWRGIDRDTLGNNLFVSEMSWSKDSTTNKINVNRLIKIPLNDDGSVDTNLSVQKTKYISNDKCDSNLNWATGLRVVTVKGKETILLGHDKGLALFDSNIKETGNLDLSLFGRLFGDMQFSPDQKRLYAVPQCKAVNDNNDFYLPYGATTEKSDRNLIAILDLTGNQLQIASTPIDINGDKKSDNGIDMDYYFVKIYIRSFQSTLPIPPVVYTGPQIAVGSQALFVRGTGLQGGITLKGETVLSSSGMGQVQDIGVFDLSNGQGIVFKNYMPFFDGLSSGAGHDSGQWGFDLGAPNEENSTGAILYLQGNSTPSTNKTTDSKTVSEPTDSETKCKEGETLMPMAAKDKYRCMPNANMNLNESL